jgi:hypothetical protein
VREANDNVGETDDVIEADDNVDKVDDDVG